MHVYHTSLTFHHNHEWAQVTNSLSLLSLFGNSSRRRRRRRIEKVDKASRPLSTPLPKCLCDTMFAHEGDGAPRQRGGARIKCYQKLPLISDAYVETIWLNRFFKWTNVYFDSEFGLLDSPPTHTHTHTPAATATTATCSTCKNPVENKRDKTNTDVAKWYGVFQKDWNGIEIEMRILISPTHFCLLFSYACE